VKPFTVLLPEPLIEAIRAEGKESHRAIGPQIRWSLELLYSKEVGIKKPSKADTQDGHTQAN